MNNKEMKVILPIIIVIIIIIILAILMKKNSQKNDEITNIEENNSEPIEIMDINEVANDFIQNENVINNSNYIEMTEQNYKEYNTDNKTFRVQDVTNNNNGTMTIKGRVYEYVKMPEILSQDQYQALIDGKALKILGEKVFKVENDKKAQEAGYDICLEIESEEYDYEMLYYAQKNEDGTATLYEGSEASIADGTNIYMQITLDENLLCQNGPEQTTLKQYFANGYHIKDKNRTRLILKTIEFNFQDEKCISIDVSEL